MSTITPTMHLTITLTVDKAEYQLAVRAELNDGCLEGGSSYHGWTPDDPPFIESVRFDGVESMTVDGVAVEPDDRLEKWICAGLQADYRRGGGFEKLVDEACLRALAE